FGTGCRSAECKVLATRGVCDDLRERRPGNEYSVLESLEASESTNCNRDHVCRRGLRRGPAARAGSKCSDCPGSLDIFGRVDRGRLECERNWFRHCDWVSDLVL